MKRLCQKLAQEVRSIAAEISASVGRLPDGAEPPSLPRAELALRDAVANLRRVRNELNGTEPVAPSSIKGVGT